MRAGRDLDAVDARFPDIEVAKSDDMNGEDPVNGESSLWERTLLKRASTLPTV
jgi:hypothetical protein